MAHRLFRLSDYERLDLQKKLSDRGYLPPWEARFHTVPRSLVARALSGKVSLQAVRDLRRYLKLPPLRIFASHTTRPKDRPHGGEALLKWRRQEKALTGGLPEVCSACKAPAKPFTQSSNTCLWFSCGHRVGERRVLR